MNIFTHTQLRLFETPLYPISATPELDVLLASGAPVALGISGGKDSTAAAHATCQYLDQLGHAGPRVLIHSDLGRVEWADSLPTCERLADRLGLELIVVRRQAGDLLSRWQQRWANNVARYANLECVKLILPWSTAAMRFCTSELKTAIIGRELVRRFLGQTIVSVAGLRREESPARAKAPIVAASTALASRTTSGFNWHPILEWSKAEVFDYHRLHGLPLHEAYTRYGSSRVSCAFCILGSQSDLAASATCEGNQELYRAMVDLEIVSTFSFQERWLGDVAPHLLSEAQRQGLIGAKRRAARREAAEARIPKHLLFVKGKPTQMPTRGEAELLAEVRRAVAQAVGIDAAYLDADSIALRYMELMAAA